MIHGHAFHKCLWLKKKVLKDSTTENEKSLRKVICPKKNEPKHPAIKQKSVPEEHDVNITASDLLIQRNSKLKGTLETV